eukprot:TRINITY_DN8146_c0_g1_i1.p1 TRINITY_DN8146_c0_g1~~TRINITY_DN8146_c0_g1_i1.p1  ORF type:complete len:179 (+),score=39.23 TRINITY_DN8146_c0_g1_i1:234-770(+)
MSYATLLDFLNYLYTGVTPVSEQAVKDLLVVANNYGLPFLRQACENELMGGKTKHLTVRASTISAHLAGVLDKNMFADCEIYVQGSAFLLHKFVLSARSKYFAKLLKDHRRKGKNDEQISVEGVSKTVFRSLLDFIYTDSLRRVESAARRALSSGGSFRKIRSAKSHLQVRVLSFRKN